MMFLKRKKILDICVYGHEALREVSQSIGVISPEIRELAASMVNTMYKANGIGLAAPQVGKNLRMVALHIPMDREQRGLLSPGEMALLPKMPMVLINPEIIVASEQTDVAEEGCLSVPNIYGEVRRSVTVTLRSQVLDSDPIMFECGGLLARCIQHELDHLDGKLFVDRASKSVRDSLKKPLERLTKDYKKTNYLRKL
ncbi:peptide deformylase [Lentisphaerota bacterium WC36G]|nr:peptide deformylase [Lentisphaerae bacterium WC36]